MRIIAAIEWLSHKCDKNGVVPEGGAVSTKPGIRRGREWISFMSGRIMGKVYVVRVYLK